MDNDYAYKIYANGTLMWELYDRDLAISKAKGKKDRYTDIFVSFKGKTIIRWRNGKKV